MVKRKSCKNKEKIYDGVRRLQLNLYTASIVCCVASRQENKSEKMLLNVKYQNTFWSSLYFCAFSLNLFELRFCLLRLCILRSYIWFILLFYNISCQWAMFPVTHISLRAARYGPLGRKPPRFRFRKSGSRLGRKSLQKTSWLSSFKLRAAKNIATSVNNWRGSRGSQAGGPS